ncbi:hypothetical protein ANCCEY_04547, partial [Ancylostoma ceylanicum]
LFFSANWLKDNIRVFAICACSEERGAYTGEWQRVEVLSCDIFANVLFLDSGGTELVVPYSLYKIHPMFVAFSLVLVYSTYSLLRLSVTALILRCACSFVCTELGHRRLMGAMSGVTAQKMNGGSFFVKIYQWRSQFSVCFSDPLFHEKVSIDFVYLKL